MKAEFKKKKKKKKFKPVTLELTFESEKEMKALYHALCLYSCDVLDALDDVGVDFAPFAITYNEISGVITSEIEEQLSEMGCEL